LACATAADDDVVFVVLVVLVLAIEELVTVPWRANPLKPKRRKKPFRNLDDIRLYKIGLIAELR
jgi:hypothetical protein